MALQRAKEFLLLQLKTFNNYKFLTKASICLLGVLVGFFLIAGSASAVSGGDFKASRIIDDSTFFGLRNMNAGDIQNFLNAKVPSCDTNGTRPMNGSSGQTRAQYSASNGRPAPPYTCLKDYSQNFNSVSADTFCGSVSGGTKSAASIIFDVSQACGVSPQSLIVLLQKEQALVTDDWPYPVQYQSATGYGCPDTAACDSQYYGFFNQVYMAARQFKRYTMRPEQYNYAAGRTSFIAYNPIGSCNGTNVTIENPATAALYNYTPYQPNSAALNNLYGTGDSCSAYGNRNFWRLFNDWFGPTTGNGFTLAKNEDDNSQWVLYGNIKQYVPSPEIIEAWGLGTSPVVMSGDYLSKITTGPSLGRLFYTVGSSALYFADGGKKYYVPSQQMKDSWGLNGQGQSTVSRDLGALPRDSGSLTYSVKAASNPALYMIDGLNSSQQMVLRQYSNPDVFRAFEGDTASFTTISDTLFNSFDNAIGTSLTGFTVKPVSSNSQYHVISGQKLYLSGQMAPLFNQAYTTISDTTANRLVTSSPVTNFVRLPGDGVVIYMVDNGQKLPVSSGSVLKAWSPGGVISVNILNQGFLNLLTTGATVSGYEADVAGQLYLVDGSKYSVSTELDSTYRTGAILSASSTLMNLFSNNTATGFIKGSSNAIYLLDNGTKRHIPSAQIWQLWNGTRNEALTIVSEAVLSQFADASPAGYYFSNSGTNYVIDNGTYRSASNTVALDWGLVSPIAIASATKARFNDGGSLKSNVQIGSTYYRVKYAKSHGTADVGMAALWGLTNSPTSISTNLLATVGASNPLSIFARSTDTADRRIFVVDNAGTNFYALSSIQQKQNYGPSNDATEVSPSDLGTVGIALDIIKTSNSNTERVLDNGVKRDFSSSAVRNRWVTVQNTLTVSTELWERIPNGTTLTGNIKGNAPNVYTVNTGQKQWIMGQPSYQSYVGLYGAYTNVSEQLLHVLPSGINIP